MRYGAAMRFGGQLVEAIACDYNDYKYLGLLCPECKDPIFLRAESVRVAGEKEIKISPHFSHFPVKDPTLAKVCEQRIAQYTEAELQKRVSQARGQRLKFFQRWFWKCITNFSIELGQGDLKNHIQRVESSGLRRSACLDCVRLLKNRGKSRMQTSFLEDVKEDIDNAFTQVLNDMGRSPCRNVKDRIDRLSELDSSLHCQIATEVVAFLTAKRQQELLAKTIIASLAFANLEAFPTDDKLLSYVMVNCFFMLIVSIPWSDEFARIQKQESDRAIKAA